MRKLTAGIHKEFMLLLHDKVGLSMMIFLPILLVIVITSIQNSAFNLVNNNQIELILVNDDKDSLSQELIHSLTDSKLFKISYSELTEDELNNQISNSDIPFGLYISENFSNHIKQQTQSQLQNLKYALGLQDELIEDLVSVDDTSLVLIYNPIVQGNYAQSVEQMLFAIQKKQATKHMLGSLTKELDLGENTFDIDNSSSNSDLVLRKSSFDSSDAAIPNASQHNVPAWSIFAVFFMVISLASNFVKEKLNGSFDRVLTMPSSVWYLLGSKSILFLLVALFQVVLIFTISRFLFQYIGLPTLYFPAEIVGFIWAILLTGMTAVTYSLMIGVYSSTVEQATGFGALSVIIFSAIGGIWVPSFIMPPFLKFVANFSPLHWCIELFYTIFLKNGDLSQLTFPSLILLAMNVTFILFIYFKLRKLNILRT